MMPGIFAFKESPLVTESQFMDDVGFTSTQGHDLPSQSPFNPSRSEVERVRNDLAMSDCSSVSSTTFDSSISEQWEYKCSKSDDKRKLRQADIHTCVEMKNGANLTTLESKKRHNISRSHSIEDIFNTSTQEFVPPFPAQTEEDNEVEVTSSPAYVPPFKLKTEEDNEVEIINEFNSKISAQVNVRPPRWKTASINEVEVIQIEQDDALTPTQVFVTPPHLKASSTKEVEIILFEEDDTLTPTQDLVTPPHLKASSTKEVEAIPFGEDDTLTPTQVFVTPPHLRAASINEGDNRFTEGALTPTQVFEPPRKLQKKLTHEEKVDVLDDLALSDSSVDEQHPSVTSTTPKYHLSNRVPSCKSSECRDNKCLKENKKHRTKSRTNRGHSHSNSSLSQSSDSTLNSSQSTYMTSESSQSSDSSDSTVNKSQSTHLTSQPSQSSDLTLNPSQSTHMTSESSQSSRSRSRSNHGSRSKSRSNHGSRSKSSSNHGSRLKSRSNHGSRSKSSSNHGSRSKSRSNHGSRSKSRRKHSSSSRSNHGSHSKLSSRYKMKQHAAAPSRLLDPKGLTVSATFNDNSAPVVAQTDVSPPFSPSQKDTTYKKNLALSVLKYLEKERYYREATQAIEERELKAIEELNESKRKLQQIQDEAASLKMKALKYVSLESFSENIDDYIDSRGYLINETSPPPPTASEELPIQPQPATGPIGTLSTLPSNSVDRTLNEQVTVKNIHTLLSAQHTQTTMLMEIGNNVSNEKTPRRMLPFVSNKEKTTHHKASTHGNLAGIDSTPPPQPKHNVEPIRLTNQFTLPTFPEPATGSYGIPSTVPSNSAHRTVPEPVIVKNIPTRLPDQDTQTTVHMDIGNIVPYEGTLRRILPSVSNKKEPTHLQASPHDALSGISSSSPPQQKQLVEQITLTRQSILPTLPQPATLPSTVFSNPADMTVSEPVTVKNTLSGIASTPPPLPNQLGEPSRTIKPLANSETQSPLANLAAENVSSTLLNVVVVDNPILTESMIRGVELAVAAQVGVQKKRKRKLLDTTKAKISRARYRLNKVLKEKTPSQIMAIATEITLRDITNVNHNLPPN